MSRSSEDKGGIRYDSQFLRIEELIKGRTFSRDAGDITGSIVNKDLRDPYDILRDEISHLLAILNSRVDVELEKHSRSDTREDTEQVGWIHEIPRMTAGDIQHVTDRDTLGTLPGKLDVPVGVGASPIDIARAYMTGRTLEQGHDLHSYTSKGERAEPSNKFSQQTPVPSPLPKSSICWPGAVLNDHHGYNTPQSQSGRFALRDFPRTPYSRTISSKSTAKLNANSRFANTPTAFQQSPTSRYGQVSSSVNSVDIYGSVGPIRRIRNKFASEVRPRESMILSSIKDVPSEKLNSNFFSSVLPASKRNLEPGETSGASKCLTDANASVLSDRVAQNADSSYGPAVKKILEHLDRNKPTPKEKEAETKLVTEWKKSPSDASDTIREENTSSLYIGELASLKNTGLSGLNSTAEINKNSSTPNYFVRFHDKGMDMATKDAASVNPKAPSTISVDSGTVPGVSAVPSFGFGAPSGPVVKNSYENAFATTSHAVEKNVLYPLTSLSNGPDLKASTNSTASGFSKNHGTKPSLPSISVNKPEIRAFNSDNFNSDNGPGFTFPVCSAAGVLSEPPTTPSILPSSSIIPQPTYSFGAKKSNSGLVFSFPSSSNASTIDASDLKFSFGSDSKTRLSFSSFDADAICY
ncbi:hypothetical protein F511_31718 [Dorcoceras hygrometricum]|uniref:Nuclear pore complex protein NUP1 n=1 Tax=Dorcoceras hygrometricum TaxID=472368 RepID=A0A2Z7AIE9_9LAMI|nr:hypothetical protein F511_31718 [Dorcoceras hygrometricum]